MPERFAALLIGHEAQHVVDLGWRHVTNGKLLALAEASGFAVFITKDTNLPFQQNLRNSQLSVLILRLHTQDMADLLALTPDVLLLLSEIKPDTVKALS